MSPTLGGFEGLTQQSVLPRDFLPTMVDTARLRNVLVYEYARVDDALMYGIL
jgi:uncharacterized protein YutE (UPF0331/DUF86 family)